MGKLLTKTDWQRSSNAVKPRAAEPFREWMVPQPYLDQLERCRLARSVGSSWRPEK